MGSGEVFYSTTVKEVTYCSHSKGCGKASKSRVAAKAGQWLLPMWLPMVTAAAAAVAAAVLVALQFQ